MKWQVPPARRTELARTLAAVVVAAWYVGYVASPAARAEPASGAHETVDITTSTAQPGASAGFSYSAVYHGDADGADPPALRRLVIALPRGTRTDTSVLPQCTASDETIRMMGDAACPPGSRIGSGQATAKVIALGTQTFETTVFNGPDQQIEIIESGNGVGADGVARTYIHGTTLDGPVPTCLTGGSPPSGCPFDQIALLENHLTTRPVTVGQGAARRNYGTTPPTCPSSGKWRTPVTLHYADGTTETVVTTQPCTRARRAAVIPRRHRRCHHLHHRCKPHRGSPSYAG